MKWTARRDEPDEPVELDGATKMALRDGLRAQPTPATSADFDARVLAAVHGRSPVWGLVFSSLRPALATAAVSTMVTTFVLMAPNRTNPAITPAHHVVRHPIRDGITLRRAIASGAYIGVEALRAPAVKDKKRLPGG